MKNRDTNKKVTRPKSINPRKEPLTAEKLRSFEGLEDLSDEEAQEAVFTIRAFASIVFDHYIETHPETK